MVCSNASQTVQQFEHNPMSPEFPGAVSALNLLEAPFHFRENLIFFSMIFEPKSI